MKKFFAFISTLVILAVMFAAGFASNELFYTDGKVQSPVVITRAELIDVLNKELAPEIIELSERTADNTRTNMRLMTSWQRTQHYVAGHDHKHPIEGCPECGLLYDLDNRHMVLDEHISRLSAANESLDKESPEYKQNLEGIVKYTAEQQMLSTLLLNKAELSNQLSSVVKATKIVDGKATVEIPEGYGSALKDTFKGKETEYLQHPPQRLPQEYLEKIKAQNDRDYKKK